MSPDEYLKTRVQDQIEWFDRKSMANKNSFKRLQAMEIIAAAFIPLLSGLAIKSEEYRSIATITSGVLGFIVAIVAGFLRVGSYQENWIDYRNKSENLKKEKILFETGVEPYDTEEGFRLLVQKVEALVTENTNWGQHIKKGDRKADSR